MSCDVSVYILFILQDDNGSMSSRFAIKYLKYNIICMDWIKKVIWITIELYFKNCFDNSYIFLID